MVIRNLLACLASAVISSNSLADNVQDIRHEMPIIETVNNRSYDFETVGYVSGTLLGTIGLLGAISLANKYVPKLINKNKEQEATAIGTRAIYGLNPNLKINLGDGHFHG